MAFPTQSVIDDFNRASIGANWTTDPMGAGDGALALASDQVDGDGTDDSGYYNVTTYGPNTEVFVDCTTWAASSNQKGISLFARITTPGAGTCDGYRMRFLFDSVSGSNDLCTFDRIDNGTATEVAFSSPTNHATSDSFGFELSGSTMKGYRKRSGTWTEIFSSSDGTYTGAGSIGLAVNDTSNADNFGGGTFTPPTQVVYQDQGAGAATATSGAALSASCPATVNAGDILLAHVCYRDTSSSPSTPSGWTSLRGPENCGAPTVGGRHWVFGKIADGSEDSASISFGTAGGTVVRHARIYRFTGDTWTGQTLTNIVAGFSASAGTSTSILDQDVTTPVDGCVAVNFVYRNDDLGALIPFTGESGGDWVEPVSEFTTSLGSDGGMQIQTAQMATAGTIGGGTFTTDSDPWGVIGCYVRPAIVTTAPFVLNQARDYS